MKISEIYFDVGKYPSNQDPSDVGIENNVQATDRWSAGFAAPLVAKTMNLKNASKTSRLHSLSSNVTFSFG